MFTSTSYTSELLDDTHLKQRQIQRPQVIIFANNLHTFARFDVDQFDTQHRWIHDEMTAVVEGDVHQMERIGLLQIPLVGHPAKVSLSVHRQLSEMFEIRGGDTLPSSKLHVRQRLGQLLTFAVPS